MKLNSFKEFRQSQGLDGVVPWLATELAGILRELRTGLPKITFLENFESFEVQDLAIPAASEVRIRNQSRSFVPSRWIVTRKNEGGIYVCEGDQEWNENYLYLKNVHATEAALITVLFLR